ncbi:21531_t:CDS:1 [Cetraspora pellucida]|uniref:21531_t:CDS:1 n=1 Tax=Cetraspora pellucida TaxID=1433469 RepID=A0A9N9NT01_9GLOM|nr:21531_t:CDS:1 [Cetraspora pellucida]
MFSISEIEQLNLEELVRSHYKNGKNMNAFFLYRQEYMKRVRASGIREKMTNISKLAAESWRKEPPKIRRAFTNISKQIEELLQRRRQSKKTYQIVYDPNMEKVQQISQKAESITYQHVRLIQYVPTLYYPTLQHNEYIYSFSVDDIAFLYWAQFMGFNHFP